MSVLLRRSIPGETAGQGDGIQPRMSEMWDALGIGAELREASAQVHRIVSWLVVLQMELFTTVPLCLV